MMTDQLYLRPVTEDDIPALAALMHHVWSQDYAGFVPASYCDAYIRPEQCHEYMTETIAGTRNNPEQHYAVGLFDQNNKLLGYSGITPCDADFYDMHTDGFQAELERLYIHPDHRNQKLGPQLLQALAQWCKERDRKRIFFGTFADNKKANAFYERHGAKIFSRLVKDYTGTELELLVMGWDDFPSTLLAE